MWVGYNYDHIWCLFLISFEQKARSYSRPETGIFEKSVISSEVEIPHPSDEHFLWNGMLWLFMEWHVVKIPGYFIRFILINIRISSRILLLQSIAHQFRLIIWIQINPFVLRDSSKTRFYMLRWSPQFQQNGRLIWNWPPTPFTYKKYIVISQQRVCVHTSLLLNDLST